MVPPGGLEPGGTDPNNPPIVVVDTTSCPPGVISFTQEILPLLTSNCGFSPCHDSKSAEEGVILVSYETIRKHVSAGNPSGSKLYRSLRGVSGNGGEDLMPPRGYQQLTAAQIKLLYDWIAAGAKNTSCTNLDCQAANPTYSGHIALILQGQCVGCHNASNRQGNIDLSSYTQVKTYGANGRLLGSIKHSPGYVAMPQGTAKMDDCRIGLIEKWIAAGMPNN
ncbi:MAG: hypothetical protein H6555_03225 [Lewinellaceae bacterium]|nr:hypothetical protein [Lewinellaceae bacterium]